MPRLLLLEDHEFTRISLERLLVQDGFTVQAAANGQEALAMLAASAQGEAPVPDLAILDRTLPDLDGLEVLRAIRQDPALKAMPVIFLTSRTEEIDRILGLELGADDYVPKPFSPRELVARIRAIFRRIHPVEPVADKVLRHGPIQVNLDRFEAAVEGEPVALTRRELELLLCFLRRPGVVLSRQQIFKEVWKLPFNSANRTVDVHIQRLRAKLGPCADRMATVIGVGYRLD